MDDRSWLPVKWPAPEHIHAGCTTRLGGVSRPPYDSFNLAMHVQDDPQCVSDNRRRLAAYLGLPDEPRWLQQVHGCEVSTDDRVLETADACVTQTRGRVCVVMTADCLPLLMTDRKGTCVAAVHAGWKGLANNAISQTIEKMPVATSQLLVWLGPAIGPQAFEVGEEVREEFLGQNASFADCFVTGKQPGKWLLNIYQLARLQLAACAVENIYGGSFCTYHDKQRFYSYRRDKTTGRMASLIWMDAQVN